MNTVLHPVNSNHIQDKMQKSDNEKFKATKLWNEMVYAFYMGISVAKHRRNMRTYNDCFPAREAVSWMHHHLQVDPYFNNVQISRFQALNLLRKFLKAEIIERVNCNSNEEEEYEFQDNKELYKFTIKAHENMPFMIDDSRVGTDNVAYNALNTTPAVSSKTPQQQLYHQYHYVNGDSLPVASKHIQQHIHHQLSVSDISQLWKTTLFKQLISLIGPMLDECVSKDNISPLMIMHNLTRLSDQGVVELKDKTEDLPHWVMSAMKCLAHWPKVVGTGSCLPKYPGFENDVFHVIRDYFVNSGLPLIPTHLYSLFIAAFDLSNIRLNRNFRHSSLRRSIGKERRYMNINASSLPVSPIEPNPNHSHKTSTPVLNHYDVPKMRNSNNLVLPPNHVFETVFVGNSPITKVVSIDEIAHLFEANPRLVYSRSFNGSLPRRRSSGRGNISVEQIKKDQQEQGRYVYAVTTMPRKREARRKRLMEGEVTDKNYVNVNGNVNTGDHDYYNNFGFAMMSPSESGEYMMDKSVSLSPSSIAQHMQHDNDDSLSIAMAISESNSSPASQSGPLSDQRFGVSRQTLKALQLSLFLLPTANRRHLHLLLKLLWKMINNKELNLYIDKKISIKQFLVETFTRSIICSDKETQYDEVKARKLVIILLEHCKELFSVPESLIQEVKSQENQLENKQVRYDANVIDNNNSESRTRFCQPITSEEFEMQKHILSHQALADLLMSIVEDKKMSSKDKKRLLKQFKAHHPDVYNWHFPTDEAYVKCLNSLDHKKSPSTTPTTPKTIPSQKSSLIRRILSMRL